VRHVRHVRHKKRPRGAALGRNGHLGRLCNIETNYRSEAPASGQRKWLFVSKCPLKKLMLISKLRASANELESFRSNALAEIATIRATRSRFIKAVTFGLIFRQHIEVAQLIIAARRNCLISVH
jgi:hypothetical protein